MSSWHSYPKIWNLGHASAKELLLDEVVVEEKIDGSQFSFGSIDGELKIRSKGQQMNIDAPEKMFSLAVDTVKNLFINGRLIPGWTYSGEYLQKAKHNVLAYDRTPKGYIILFDIRTDEEQYLNPYQKQAEAERLGLEVVPELFAGRITDAAQLMEFMDRISVLGGQKIEGFVIKNYKRFGIDKKALMGKHVSEAFKEKHKVDWKTENPSQGDIVEVLCQAYRTPARWDKAIIHLKEQGKIEGTPRDIGALILESKADLEKECAEEIKEALFKWAFPKIARAMAGGLPEYYKQQLLKQQFAEVK